MLQPVFPLEYSKVDGPYLGIKEIRNTIKQNVVFLLSVSPGEWPGNPELGCGIRNFLFENYGSKELNDIHVVIKDQFSKYMPFLTVKSDLIEQDSSGEFLPDVNRMKLSVSYYIKPLDLDEYVEIEL